MEARRLEAARLFARGESQAAVAKAVGVTRVSAHHWFHAWKTQGRRGLKAAGRLGRKPQLDAAQLTRVDRALRRGPRAHGFSTELWTLPRVASVIEHITGVRHHPGHVWRVLRRLGWSLQRPTRQARERDERVIAAWKTRRWPQLKKTPPAAAAGWSSRTKAASRSSPSSAGRGRPAARRPS
jgi:transposase